MIEPLRLSFTVASAPERAFEIWTAEASDWWPAGHTSSGEPGCQVVFEPGAGGRIFERTPQGEEIDWGRILVWQPPERLAYSWHLRADETDATEVHVAFAPLPGGGCLVEIEHRGWERLGERGPGWRERNKRGWGGVLPHLIAACGGGELRETAPHDAG